MVLISYFSNVQKLEWFFLTFCLYKSSLSHGFSCQTTFLPFLQIYSLFVSRENMGQKAPLRFLVLFLGFSFVISSAAVPTTSKTHPLSLSLLFSLSPLFFFFQFLVFSLSNESVNFFGSTRNPQIN